MNVMMAIAHRTAIITNEAEHWCKSHSLKANCMFAQRVFRDSNDSLSDILHC